MSTFMTMTFKPYLSMSTAVRLSLRQCWGRTVLITSLAVLASACDSTEQASVPPVESGSQAKLATADKAVIDTSSAAITGSAESDLASLNPIVEDIDLDDDGGAGLLEFAEHRQSMPMITDDPSNSLGATLIGDYSGMLPCLDCQGGQSDKPVILNLYADGTAHKTNQPQQSANPSNTPGQEGSYQQLDNIISIDFANRPTEYYLIHDNQLIFIEGDLPDIDETDAIQANPKYVLSRI